MHALGNDFMVLDSIRQKLRLSPEIICEWGDRRTGVGFDQLLLIEEHSATDADFKYRIFNVDGSEVEQCGNGARCVARFIFDTRLSKKKILKLKTCNGLVTTKLLRHDWIKASLGVPDFSPHTNPPPCISTREGIGLSDYCSENGANFFSLPCVVGEGRVGVHTVSIGNPHAVIQVTNVETADVANIGSSLQKQFPNGVNVEFMEIITRDQIKLRVWERGVGETPACGSGACAAVVIGQHQALLDSKVTVQLPGGELEVEWQGGENPIYLTGSAVWVYDGLINH